MTSLEIMGFLFRLNHPQMAGSISAIYVPLGESIHDSARYSCGICLLEEYVSKCWAILQIPGTPGFFHHGPADLQSAEQKPLWGVNRPLKKGM